MKHQIIDAKIAREITYSHAVQGRAARTLVRFLENATGRIGLIRKAKGYENELGQGADFWAVIARRYGLRLDVIGGSLDDIPSTGPLIVVANHPYGILDGLMLGRILSGRRNGDFKIMAHAVFNRAEELRKVVLPISFDETKEAARSNLETRAEAIRYLSEGGAIGIFPGGTVSTASRPFDQPMDPSWRNFTAKMIAKSGATVVPVFFEGRNSRLFNLASHLHATLRVGMLIREFRARVGTDVRVVIGRPIPAETLAKYAGDAKACMDFLRKQTYDLSPRPMDSDRLGHEFEAKYKGRQDGSGGFR